MTSLKKQAIGGVKWTSLSTGIKTVLQLIQLIVLARFLSAEDFGLVAIVMVVIGFSQLFMDMGISNAIIYKKHITDIQLSSLYWLNIFAGFVLTVSVFIIAPYVASFYKEEAIISLLQLLALSFLVNSVGNQYRVLLRKELKFDVLAKVEVFAAVLAFFCAIILAVKGYGAYSLVYATLVNVIVANVIFLFIGMRSHKPSLVYSHKEIKEFLVFGLYQMAQNSIVYFNNQFDVILIGKLLGTEALGAYSLTKQLVMRPAQVINPIFTNVTFPVMAKIQNDIPRLKTIYLKVINYLSSINFIVYGLMVVLAGPLVALVLGNKWLSVITLFQILSVYAMVRSTMSPAGSLLLAKGRADLGFWWSLGEFTIMPLTIYTGSHWGIDGVALSLLTFQTLFLLPNWFFIVRKMCGASFVEYFFVQLQSLISAFLSIWVVYIFMQNIEIYELFRILMFSSLTMILYLIISYFLNRQLAIEIKNIFTKKAND